MKNAYYAIALVLIFTSSSCKKSSATTNSQLNGNVLLFDEGNSVADLSGMKVSIENSNPAVSSTSDKSGNFSLPINPSLQSFTLDYSKPGYGMFKRNYIKDATGNFVTLDMYNQPLTKGLSANESLGAASTVTVNTLNVVVSKDTLKISCNISSPNTSGEKYIRILFQKNLPDISINTIDKSRYGNWSYLALVQNGDNTIDLCLKCSTICAGWQTGDNIYMTAYGDSYYSNIYTDRITEALVFPNLKLTSRPVTAVSLTVPQLQQ